MDLRQTRSAFELNQKQYLCQLSDAFLTLYSTRRYNEALQVAEEMIEVAPGFSDGYLNKSRCLFAILRRYEAIEVLEQGVSRVQDRMRRHGVSDLEGVEDMNREKGRLVNEVQPLSPPQSPVRVCSSSPFARFPPEILMRIFQFALKSNKWGIMLVSKAWYFWVLQSSSHLSSPKFKQFVTSRQVRDFLGLCSKANVTSVKSISIDTVNGEQGKVLALVAKSAIETEELAINIDTGRHLLSYLECSPLFSSLRSLKLQFSWSPDLGTLNRVMRVITDISELSLEVVTLFDCPTEELFGINEFPNLTKLRLSAPNTYPKLQERYWWQFLQFNTFPALETLIMDHSTGNLNTFRVLFGDSLQRLVIHDHAPQSFGRLLYDLGRTLHHSPQSIEISRSEAGRIDHQRTNFAFLAGTTSLKFDMVDISSSDVLNIVQHAPNLTSLSLIYPDSNQLYLSFDQLFASCPQIESLRLSGLAHLRASLLKQSLVRHKIVLEDISLSGSHVTDQEIVDLFDTEYPLIRKIRLTGISPETITHLRTKGIDVSID